MKMIYKTSIQNLLKEGIIRPCPVDFRAISKLMSRALVDLETAERNLNEDEECAFAYAYNAMLRAGLALMFSEGYRPEIPDKHLTVVKFAASQLGGGVKRLVNDYDLARRKRNRFIYEPDIPCSRIEAQGALKTAQIFVSVIRDHIKNKNPQLELDFPKR
jgi:uncharacterized protein (UPF0332 family)